MSAQIQITQSLIIGCVLAKPVCEEPSEPVNGYTTCEEEDPSKYYEGTKCTYQCNRGKKGFYIFFSPHSLRRFKDSWLTC